jgi:uncharacterized protein YukE
MSATAVVSVWEKINGWMGPLSGAVDGLMRPLVQPLADRFDAITGDSAEVRSTAERWRSLRTQTCALAAFERDVVSRAVDGWEGEASRAFRSRLTELAEQIDEIGEEMGRTAEFLDDAAMEVELAETLVEDIIRELIEWAIITLAVSAATSVITLGLSNVAGAGVAAAKAAHASSRIAKIVLKVARALEKLSDLLRKLKVGPRVQKMALKFLIGSVVVKPVIKAGTGLTGSPLGTSASNLVTGLAGIAADEYDDQQRGGNGPQTPLRDAVDDPIRPLADHTRGISDRADGIDDRVPSPPGG